MTVYAFKPAELTELLQSNGFKILSFAGVRVAYDNDYRKVSEVPPSELANILEEERVKGANRSYRKAGQLLHFIAQKTVS